jgi:hypothetical protein
MRAGIDLMNMAYNYLELTPNGGDEGGRGQFWVGATTSTRIEDSGRNPQIIPGQKSSSRTSRKLTRSSFLDNFLLATNRSRLTSRDR